MNKELIIGRGKLSQEITDLSVSREHAVMTESGNAERPYHLKVADIRKKLWINGQQVIESNVAVDDKVELGDNHFPLDMRSAVVDFEKMGQEQKPAEELRQTTVSGGTSSRRSSDVSHPSASEPVVKKGKEVVEVKQQEAPQQEDYPPLDFKKPKLDNFLNLATIIILLCFFVIVFFYTRNLAVMIGWLVIAIVALLLRLKFKLYK